MSNIFPALVLLGLPCRWWLGLHSAPVRRTGRWCSSLPLQMEHACPNIMAPWTASTPWWQSWRSSIQTLGGRGLWRLWSSWGPSTRGTSSACPSGPSGRWPPTSWPGQWTLPRYEEAVLDWRLAGFSFNTTYITRWYKVIECEPTLRKNVFEFLWRKTWFTENVVKTDGFLCKMFCMRLFVLQLRFYFMFFEDKIFECKSLICPFVLYIYLGPSQYLSKQPSLTRSVHWIDQYVIEDRQVTRRRNMKLWNLDYWEPSVHTAADRQIFCCF